MQQRRTKKPLDESEKGEWKRWLKTQHSENLRSRHPVPSIQFSHSVVSNSLWPHEPQHTRPPCPSPIPGVTHTHPLSWWCHPAISSSVVPFFCTQSFPASGSFPMSQLLASGGQSIGVFSFNISPSSEHIGCIYSNRKFETWKWGTSNRILKHMALHKQSDSWQWRNRSCRLENRWYL